MPICCDNWVEMLSRVSSALETSAPVAVPDMIVALTELNWVSNELIDVTATPCRNRPSRARSAPPPPGVERPGEIAGGGHDPCAAEVLVGEAS